ncbi:MAG: hypothetical protein II565_14095 [Fibrobacter sp.]|nr:hypothetical protein [Fibrobacter sp.]MBQ5465350.1 hypothetical protein [Fibrobacter sp.]
MKFSHALLLASSLAFLACGDDDDSPAGPSTPSYDCSVKGGVKVVYPAGGETFKIGETITVIYGSDVEDSGYRFLFKKNAGDPGMDLFDESVGPEKPDGKTCYEQKVKLSKDIVEATSTGAIRVQPYNKSSKGNNSGLFIVKE